MGVNDDREMLEVAQAECVRLEAQVAELQKGLPLVMVDDHEVCDQQKAEALRETELEWAGYFASIGSHVGDPEFSQELVVKQLRGPRPFGKAGK